MASAYLHRTNGTATNSQKMTFSTWFKIGTGAAQKSLFGSVTGSGPYTQVKIMQLATHNNVFRFEASSIEGNAIDLKTNRVFRDPGAWYHLVVAIDTTQVSSSDRAKIYINGVQETSFATSTYPTQNDTLAGPGMTLDIGATGAIPPYSIYRVGNSDTTNNLQIDIFNGSIGQELFLIYAESNTGTVRFNGVSNNLVLTGAGSNLDLTALGQSVHLLCIDNGSGVGVWYVVGGTGYTVS